jgi:hypothetical protein
MLIQNLCYLYAYPMTFTDPLANKNHKVNWNEDGFPGYIRDGIRYLEVVSIPHQLLVLAMGHVSSSGKQSHSQSNSMCQDRTA